MASLKIRVVSNGIERFIDSLPSDVSKGEIMTTSLFNVIALMTQRIHIDGKKADGSAIGKYTPNYLKKREEAGRLEGNKKVFAMTSQLEGSWTVVEAGDAYGIGFQGDRLKDSLSNAGLAEILDKKNPGVFKLSESERETLVNTVLELYKEKVGL